MILHQVWEYRRAIILIATPILLIPLLTLDRKEATGGYILLLMGVYWVTEVIPLAATSIIPVVLVPLLGIASGKHIAPFYMTDTCMLFMGSLMVATAFEHQNVHKRIALQVLSFMGSDPRFLFLGFMLPTWFLSMWINNTSATAMMVPIVDAVLQQIYKDSRSTELENGNNGGNYLLEEPGQENAGSIVEVCADQQPEDRERNIEVLIEKEETYSDNVYLQKGLFLAIAYSSSIGGISTLTGTAPNLILYGNIQEMSAEGSGLNFGSWMLMALPVSFLFIIITWIWLLIVFVGYKKVFTFSRDSRKDAVVKQIIRNEKEKMGPIKFGEASCMFLFSLLILLWFTKDMGSIGWSRLFMKDNVKYVKDSQPAILIALLTLVWPARNPFNRDTESFRLYGSGVLMPWSVLQHRFPWGILILMGGGLALAETCQVSNLSEYIGQQLEFLHNVSLVPVVFLLSLITSFLTEITSNTATASILVPIVLKLGVCLGVNPLMIGIPTTICCSLAFCLPVATPPNAIVFGKDVLRVVDMVRSGIILNFVGVLLVVGGTFSYMTAYFNLYAIPEWAGDCIANTNSTTAPPPTY